MQPEITVNYLAVGLCVVVALPVGFLWFGPLFGRPWARHMGMEGMAQPGRPSTWRVGVDDAPWAYGVNGAAWTWLGFFLPMQMGRVAWEQKRWGLVAINAGFDLTRLMIFGPILAYWR